MNRSIAIDFVSDVVCPWCVIGYYQLEAALKLTGLKADIHWQPFELNPNMGPSGELLFDHVARKYGETRQSSLKARADFTARGAALGFIFNYRDDMRMVNTARAHQLLHWADSEGRAQEISLALFHAFFGDRLDLNDPASLCQVAVKAGLDGAMALEVLETARYARKVREIEMNWILKGVQSVPTVIFDNQYALTGAQGTEAFAAALTRMLETPSA